MSAPTVFLSAVTKDFGLPFLDELRIKIHDMGCICRYRGNLLQSGAILPEKLRNEIEAASCVIHLVGPRFGYGPTDALLPALECTPAGEYWKPACQSWWPFPVLPKKRSYTQMEYDFATQLGRPVFVIFVEDLAILRAATADQSKEETLLQTEHRRAIEAHGHERVHTDSVAALATIIEKLPIIVQHLSEQVLSIQKQQAGLKQEVHRSHRTIKLVVGLLLALGTGMGAAFHFTQKGIAEVKAGQTIDTVRIKAHLRESSERQLEHDLQAADLQMRSDERQRLKDSAQAAHQYRIAGIDELANSFALLEGQRDASAELKEMTRRLQEEGVDSALRYIEGQRPALLARVAAADAAQVEKKRAQLQPLLQAAALQRTKGQISDALDSYQDLLNADPQWPDVLEGSIMALFDQSCYFETNGPLADAVTSAEEGLAHAQCLYDLDQTQPSAQRTLYAMHIQRGDVLRRRSAEGDAEQILQDYERGLELAEALYNANRDSTEAVRDVSICHDRLGEFLAQRRQPGDREAALEHFTRENELFETIQTDDASAQAVRDVATSLSRLGEFLHKRGQPGDADSALKHFTRGNELLEKLLAEDPDSAEATRDVSLSLLQLGDFLAERGQPGDAEAALQHYSRSLAQREKLLSENPDSAQGVRDVSVSLSKLGDFLALRRQPGNAETALNHYTRSLELAEKLLADNPDSAQAISDVSISLERLGEFLGKRSQPGDAEAALQHLTRCLDLREKLLADNPDSAQSARNVSMILNKLGDFMAQRGQPGAAEAALKDYTRSLNMCEKLLASNPDSAEATRDVSLSLNQLGDFLAERGQPGDAEAALQHYSRSLAQREKLLSENPNSAQGVRDVSVSLNKLGDFLALRREPGNAETVLNHYKRSLELTEKLLADNPDSAQTESDVSISLERLGEFLSKRSQPGDAEAALQHLTRCLDLREKLLADNPDSAQSARDVSMILNKLGDFMAQRGQPGDAESALKDYRRSLNICEKLLASNPDSAQAKRDVFIGLQELGIALSKRHQPEDVATVTQYFDRCIQITEELFKADPSSGLVASDLADICMEYGEHAKRTEQGDPQRWWKRALDILTDKQQKGMFLSANDEVNAAALRAKAL